MYGIAAIFQCTACLIAPPYLVSPLTESEPCLRPPVSELEICFRTPRAPRIQVWCPVLAYATCAPGFRFGLLVRAILSDLC